MGAPSLLPHPRSCRAEAGGRSRDRRAGCLDFARHERTGGIWFAGYAALFDVADAARDTIRRGAFARTLRERREPLPLLWEHRAGQRIGEIERVEEDGRGLRVIARVERMGSRAAGMLAARAVSGLSFGYRARGFRMTPAGRVLEEVELFEVSLVTRPLQHRARVHLILPTRGEVAARQG